MFECEKGLDNTLGLEMAASTVDEMEERLEKQQLCWNANNMGVSSDDMEWEDEGQGRRDIIKKAKVGSKSKNVCGKW